MLTLYILSNDIGTTSKYKCRHIHNLGPSSSSCHYKCIYIYIDPLIYVYIHIYIYTHSHTHIHTIWLHGPFGVQARHRSGYRDGSRARCAAGATQPAVWERLSGRFLGSPYLRACFQKGDIDRAPLKGYGESDGEVGDIDMDVDLEVDVDVDSYFGCLNAVSKSVKVVFNGI